jgi:hypothetical protein
MALQDALGTVGDPVSRALRSTFGKPSEEATTLTPEQGMQRRIARGTVAEEQLPGLLEGSMSEATKAQADIAKQRTGMAERGKAIGEEFAVKERELIESPEYKQKEIPAFEPSQSNLEDIRNVLGLSIVAGFLAGGASKRSGMAAMAALNGAVEGFRQGRQDVYKREIDVFAKNVEAIKENNKQTLERFNRAMGLLQTDRKAAEGELKVLEAEVQNSVAAAALRQGQYKQAQDALFKAVEGSDRASQTMLQLKQQAELKREQIAAQERARKEALQSKINLANQNFVLRLAEFNRKVDQDQAKITSLGKEEKKNLQGIDNLKAELEDLQRIALQNPEKFFGFGTDTVGNVVASYREKVLKDPEMSSFIRRFEAFQIPERHDKFGATLTGNEKESWRRSIIGPGNDPSAISEYFTTKLMILDRARNNIINSPYRASAPASAQAQLGTAAQQAAGMGVNLGPFGSVTFQPPSVRQSAQSGSSDIQSERARANEAIRNGAPRDAVARRFKENTGQEL